MEELYRLAYNNTGSEGMSLVDIAILTRLIDAEYRMCGHRAWNKLEMSIRDIRMFNTDVTFDDAEKELALFVMKNGVSALVNKVVKMSADKLNARSFEAYESTANEKMYSIGPSCVWCDDKNCANCPYVETPTGKNVQWYKSDGKVKHIK